jgi:hypothetical protein
MLFDRETYFVGDDLFDFVLLGDFVDGHVLF